MSLRTPFRVSYFKFQCTFSDVLNLFSILASQLRADWSVTLDRLDNKYYVTWGSSLTASVTPAADAGKDDEAAVTTAAGGSLPPQGKMLGKLDQKDFKEVIAKGMKTYGMFSELNDVRGPGIMMLNCEVKGCIFSGKRRGWKNTVRLLHLNFKCALKRY